jgi:hypothetical protein
MTNYSTLKLYEGRFFKNKKRIANGSQLIEIES